MVPSPAFPSTRCIRSDQFTSNSSTETEFQLCLQSWPVPHALPRLHSNFREDSTIFLSSSTQPSFYHGAHRMNAKPFTKHRCVIRLFTSATLPPPHLTLRNSTSRPHSQKPFCQETTPEPRPRDKARAVDGPRVGGGPQRSRIVNFVVPHREPLFLPFVFATSRGLTGPFVACRTHDNLPSYSVAVSASPI